MPVFSIIGEGKTDHAVLKNILIGHFSDPKKDEDDMSFRFNQPIHDETDRNKSADQENFGGWIKVFEYCASEVFQKGADFYDCIVIQIDSDRCQDKGFDVIPVDDTQAHIAAIKTRIIEAIGQEFYATIETKTYFAICVKGLECWLLPLTYFGKDNSKMDKVDNCSFLLNKALKKEPTKDFNTYLDLSKDYRKKKKLSQLYDKNPSLKIFIESLPNSIATTTP